MSQWMQVKFDQALNILNLLACKYYISLFCVLVNFRKSHHISGYEKQVNVTPPVCEG